jgi:aspartate/methionine/tyrosine aminotransferase
MLPGAVHIKPFATELYFDQYEFSCPHPLSSSDCESMSIAELLDRAGLSLAALGALPLGYSEARGIPELRARIAEQYTRVDPASVVALAAPEEGIYATMRALLEPGDGVVVLTPCYDSLVNVAEHIGCRVHRWSLQPGERGWSLDLSGLETLIEAQRPRLVVVNFPHNPTGYLPTERELEAVIAMTRRVGAWLFSDEMYRGLELDPATRLPGAADRYERCIALGGLSKAHGLPGLRTGWLVIADEPLRERVVNWKHYTTICAPAPSQWLAVAALRVADQLTARSLAQVRHNLALAAPFFERRADAFRWRPPTAGSVALVETRHADATEHCHRAAREAGVVLLPGSCIGAPPQFVRLGLGRASFGESLAAYDRYLESIG